MLNNVYTIAVLPAKEGRIEDLLAALQTLADATRQEPGCIEYGFYRDTENPNTVLSFERWADAAAEDSHWQTPHLKAGIAAMGDILETKPQIYKAKKTI